MKIAVTDIGSNTVKTKIFECDSDSLKEIYSDVRNTKLISYIQNGALSSDGIMLLCRDLNSLKDNAQKNGYDVFGCFATASLRRTSNAENIKNTVKDFCNIDIDLVSGEEEAFLSFSGVKNTTSPFPKNTLLFDMGGGSTEVVKCENGNRVFSASMNFGSLSMHLEFPDNNFDKIKAKADELLKSVSPMPLKSKNATLVGGTALAINTLYTHYFKDEPPLAMTVENLTKLYELLKPYDEKVLKLLNEKVPYRVTTVIPGLSAYLGMFEQTGTEIVTVTTSGIREGYVTEKILKNLENYK